MPLQQGAKLVDGALNAFSSGVFAELEHGANLGERAALEKTQQDGLAILAAQFIHGGVERVQLAAYQIDQGAAHGVTKAMGGPAATLSAPPG